VLRYVTERLEGGPVSSRVSRFPDVFSMAEGGSKCTEGGRKPWVDGDWRLESLVTMEACLSSRVERCCKRRSKWFRRI